MAAAGLLDDTLRPGEVRHRDPGGLLAGKSDQVLSRRMGGRCSRIRRTTTGWGSSWRGAARQLRFGHGGRDEGFDARLTAYAETGQGAAIMINANDNSPDDLLIPESIAREYHWPDYLASMPSRHATAEVAESRLAACTGALRVREQPDDDLRDRSRSSGRRSSTDSSDEEFLPGTTAASIRPNGICVITFSKTAVGRSADLPSVEGGREGKAAHRGPVLPFPEAIPDPGPGEDGEDQGRRNERAPRAGRGRFAESRSFTSEHASNSGTAPSPPWPACSLRVRCRTRCRRVRSSGTRAA